MSNKEKLVEKELAAKLRRLCKNHGSKWKETHPKQSAKVIHQLALHYRKYSPDKFSLVRSAGLLNAAIVRKPDNVDNVAQDLQHLCSHVLQLSNARNKDADLLAIAESCKRLINIIREEVAENLAKIEKSPWNYFSKQNERDKEKKRKWEKQKIAEIKVIMKDITLMYKNLMDYISDKCIEIMGDFPCKYCVMGMGSLAREEITPFSDFEHSILLDPCVDGKPEAEKQTIFDYFRWFSVIFHIIVVNMGETLLRFMYIPSLNNLDDGDDWFWDGFTPCGISFDGMVSFASKFPLGRQPTKNKPWNTELIKSVPEMLKYLDCDVALKNGYHLGQVLSKSCFVSGSKELFTLYSHGVFIKLLSDNKTNLPKIKLTARNYATEFDGLNVDLPFLDDNVMSIKQTIYRQLTLLISLIGEYHGIYLCSSYDIIEELGRRNLLHDGERCHQYIYAVSIMCEMRVRLYMSEYSQSDFISKIDTLQPSGSSSAYQLAELIGEMCTFDMFHIICSFNSELLSVLSDEPDMESIFKLYVKCSESEPGQCFLKFRSLAQLRYYSRLLEEYERRPSVNLNNVKSPKLLNVLAEIEFLAADAYNFLGNYIAAGRVFKALADCDSIQYFFPNAGLRNKLHYVKFLVEHACSEEQFKAALHVVNSALDVQHQSSQCIFGNQEQVTLILDPIDNELIFRGKYYRGEILMYLKRTYEAVPCLQAALEGLRGTEYYRDSRRLSIFGGCLHLLSTALLQLGRLNEATALGKECVEHTLKHSPHGIINVAISWAQLARCYLISAHFEKALQAFEMELSNYKKFPGEIHTLICDCEENIQLCQKMIAIARDDPSFRASKWKEEQLQRFARCELRSGSTHLKSRKNLTNLNVK